MAAPKPALVNVFVYSNTADTANGAVELQPRGYTAKELREAALGIARAAGYAEADALLRGRVYVAAFDGSYPDRPGPPLQPLLAAGPPASVAANKCILLDLLNSVPGAAGAVVQDEEAGNELEPVDRDEQQLQLAVANPPAALPPPAPAAAPPPPPAPAPPPPPARPEAAPATRRQVVVRCLLVVAFVLSMWLSKDSTDWVRWVWSTVQLTEFLLLGRHEQAWRALVDGWRQPNAAGVRDIPP